MFAKLRKVNDFSLRDKLIALFLLISIIPAIGLGLLVGVTVEKILGEQATKNTLQLINQVNTTLESSITNVQNVSYLISMDAQIKTFFPQIERKATRRIKVILFAKQCKGLHPCTQKLQESY